MGPLFDVIGWNAQYGLPTSGSYSAWTRSTLSGGFTADRDSYTAIYATAGGTALYEYEDPTSLGSAPAVSWMTTASPVDIGGSLICWESEGALGGSTSNLDCAVRVRSRDPRNFTRTMDLSVNMSLTQVSIRDQFTGTALATITPDPAVYGASAFASRWEFRWSFCPRPTGAARVTLLMCRKIGTTDWLSTPPSAFSFQNTTLSSGAQQYVRFGTLNAAAALVSWKWYSFRIHVGDDLRQAVQVRGSDPLLADEQKPSVVRGLECSPFPVSLTKGVEVSWGGGGGFDGDLFESILQYQYAAMNALLGPRFEWRSASSPAASESITFTAGKDAHDRFRHDGLAVIGCNTETVVVEYDDDPAFPSPTAAGTLNLRRFDALRIDSVDGGMVSISGSSLPEDGEVASSDARKFFVKVLAIPAAVTTLSVGDCFEIGTQRGQVLEVDDGAFLSATVGSTLAIYADRGLLLYGTPIVGKYLRATVAAANPPGGTYKIGSIVAGTTMAFDVPLEWQHDDADEATATTYRSRAGISWAYIEGPPRRTVTGTVVGDAGTFRARLRNLLRATSKYVEKPVVLAMDEADLTNAETLVLARLPDAVEFDQTGWRYLEAEDRWIPVGDASMTFEQDV